VRRAKRNRDNFFARDFEAHDPTLPGTCDDGVSGLRGQATPKGKNMDEKIIKAIWQKCESENCSPLGLALKRRGITEVMSLLDPTPREAAKHLPQINEYEAKRIWDHWWSNTREDQDRAIDFCLMQGVLTEQDAQPAG
jgi:hypothetical protein